MFDCFSLLHFGLHWHCFTFLHWGSCYLSMLYIAARRVAHHVALHFASQFYCRLFCSFTLMYCFTLHHKFNFLHYGPLRFTKILSSLYVSNIHHVLLHYFHFSSTSLQLAFNSVHPIWWSFSHYDSFACFASDFIVLCCLALYCTVHMCCTWHILCCLSTSVILI